MLSILSSNLSSLSSFVPIITGSNRVRRVRSGVVRVGVLLFLLAFAVADSLALNLIFGRMGLRSFCCVVCRFVVFSCSFFGLVLLIYLLNLMVGRMGLWRFDLIVCLFVFFFFFLSFVTCILRGVSSTSGCQWSRTCELTWSIDEFIGLSDFQSGLLQKQLRFVEWIELFMIFANFLKFVTVVMEFVMLFAEL